MDRSSDEVIKELLANCGKQGRIDQKKLTDEIYAAFRQIISDSITDDDAPIPGTDILDPLISVLGIAFHQVLMTAVLDGSPQQTTETITKYTKETEAHASRAIRTAALLALMKRAAE